MTRFAEAGRELRLQQKYNTTINQDGSIDCRKKIEPVTERVRVLTPVSRQADGEYTRMTRICSRFKLIIYPYDPSRIYRRDLTGFEVPIVERIDGEWFPCCILRPSEVQALRSFAGAAGMDCDRAIQEKDRCKVRVQEPVSRNVSGRVTPKGKSKKGYSKPRTNNKFKKMMSSIEVHNAHKKGK